MLLKLMLFFVLFIFLTCLHPLQKTLSLILFVLMILFSMSTFSSHWACYLFVLVYFGGVLILFTYISSVVPNFAPNSPPLMWPFMLSSFLFILESNSTWPLLESFNSTELPIPFISSGPTFFMLYFILSLVLMLLILSVSIMSNFKSPLRNI